MTNEPMDSFFSFLRKKIDSGKVKQVDLAAHIGKTPPYINKLYLGKQKSCPLVIQENVASFFGLTYNQMIREGSSVASKKNDSFLKESNHLKDISVNLRSLAKELEYLSSDILATHQLSIKNEYLMLVFGLIDEGITIFDSERKFVFSSNRWKFLDGISLEEQPSVERLLLHLRKKIKNFNEVSELLLQAFEKRSEESMQVDLVSGKSFFFITKPLYLNSVFKGMLLINKPT